MQSGDYTRLGLGAALRDQGQEATVVLLQKSFIDTAPIPRVLQPSDGFELRCTLSAPFVNPHLVITHDDGHIERLALRAVGVRRYAAVVGCRGKRGKEQVEIAAESERGEAVLANFPVFCGQDPPASVTWTLHAPDATDRDVATLEAELFALVNDERVRVGLAPLLPRAEVSDVARKYSEEMAHSGEVVHTSQASGRAQDRLRRAGVVTAMVAENLARAGSVADAHQGLMNSPGHRINILAREATHLGVGVARSPVPDERQDLFITEVFVRIPPVLDRAKAASELRTRVAAALQLAPSDLLDRLAASHVALLCQGQSPDLAMTQTAQAAQAAQAPFVKLRALVAVAGDLSQFDPSGKPKLRGETHFGVAVAQAHHPELGENAIYIVVLIGMSGTALN
jgi:uncharacterized protein YkwD